MGLFDLFKKKKETPMSGMQIIEMKNEDFMFNINALAKGRFLQPPFSIVYGGRNDILCCIDPNVVTGVYR